MGRAFQVLGNNIDASRAFDKQVARGGGTEPRWRVDGKEIFHIGPKGMLTAVQVGGEGTFTTGTPTPLFPLHERAPISLTASARKLERDSERSIGRALDCYRLMTGLGTFANFRT
jgi:hypothetical protein